MANSQTRVYHPNGPAWYDVPTKDVEAWEKQGWKSKRPSKFQSEDEKEIPVGEGYSVPSVPGPEVLTEDSEGNPPKGNASVEDWRGYALTQGAAAQDVENMSRDELREAYGTPE